MIGWFFIVRRLEEEGRGTEIARWQASPGGIEWVWELVRRGEASGGGDGYPSTFRVRARDVLPLLDNPPYANNPWRSDPGDILSDAWIGHTHVHGEVTRLCGSDEWIEVEVWDES